MRAQTAMNLVALGILGLLGLAMVFHAVPQGNTNALSAIIGGITGVLVGAANADKIANLLTPSLSPEPATPVADEPKP